MARVVTKDNDGTPYICVVHDYKEKGKWRQLTVGMGKNTPLNWSRAEFLSVAISKAIQRPPFSDGEWRDAYEEAAVQHLGADVLERLKEAHIFAGGT